MSRGATARLFVAVDPPAAVCQELALWARSAVAEQRLRARAHIDAGLRLLGPGTMHLTICFLGERPVAEIETIGDALRSCTAGPGELSVGAPLWLPPRRPRTLAVAIHDRRETLSRLHAAATGAFSEAIGWEPERRRFRGHVTVARLGRRAAGGRRSAEREASLPATPPLSFTPTSLVLYRSWLAPGGASYEALATSALASSGDASSAGSGEGPGAFGTRSHIGADEALERVGIEPSSQAGSEPSSQV